MVDEIIESDIILVDVGTEEARKVEEDVVRFRRGGATIGCVYKTGQSYCTDREAFETQSC